MTRARTSPRPGSRPAFTLVELLVVLGLALLLLGLGLVVNVSGITDSYKTTNAADRVSGWLLMAKTKAQRDKAPRGIRFIVGPNNQIREAQFLEVPDSYTPPPAVAGVQPRLLVVRLSGQNPRVFVTDANFVDLQQSAFIGDTLYLPEFNTLHTITSFNNATLNLAGGGSVAALEVVVRNPALLPQVPPTAGPALVPTYATNAFGFHRQPQPAIGEPTLQLTGDTVVDGAVSLPAMTADFDVLFAPSGEVMNAPRGQIILWVRDVRLPFVGIGGTRAQYEEAGQMGLVVVYAKTGAVATQPVVMPSTGPHDPYSAAKDAVNTGL